MDAPVKKMVKGGFAPGYDPRRCKNPTGRPSGVKNIPDLLRWAGGLNAPEKLVASMRQTFGINADAPLTVDQACILRSRFEAMKGNIQHLQFWAERTEGKVKDTLRVEGGQVLEIVEEIVDARGNVADRQGDPVRTEPAQE